ncbi:MAG: hypothetical protein GX383_10555 [Clostridium sp.]|nr:hypothetical protein [Clostridium sp.]
MKKVLLIGLSTLLLLVVTAFILLSGNNHNKGVRKAKYYLRGNVTKGYIEVVDFNNLKFGNFTSDEIANKVVSYYFRSIEFSEEDLKQIGERYLNGIEYSYTDNNLSIQTIESFGHWARLIYYPKEETISFMNQDYIAVD